MYRKVCPASTGHCAPPVVPSLRMYLRVTRLAQRDQIAPIMSATFTQRFLMVDLFRLHDNSTLKTQFTEGMLRCILISDSLPCTAISALGFLISAVLLIITVDLLLMLRAVSPICQIRTAGIAARSFRFPWHIIISIHSKSPEGSFPQGLASFFILHYRHYNHITAPCVTYSDIR